MVPWATLAFEHPARAGRRDVPTGLARGSGLVSNPAITQHFLENQLSYDQRRLQAAQQRRVRGALALRRRRGGCGRVPVAESLDLGSQVVLGVEPGS